MQGQAQAGWQALPRPCDGERMLPDAWGQEHWAEDGGRQGALPPQGQLEERALLRRGEDAMARGSDGALGLAGYASRNLARGNDGRRCPRCWKTCFPFPASLSPLEDCRALR